MGEAGLFATESSYHGERTLPVGSKDVTVLTQFGILPVLIALAEYAKRKHLSHSFEPLDPWKRGSVVLDWRDNNPRCPSASNEERSKQSNDSSSTTSQSSFSDLFLLIESLVLGETPLAAGRRANVWIAWREKDTAGNRTSLVCKEALPLGLEVDGDGEDPPPDVEVAAYGRAQSQGICFPELVAVLHNEELVQHARTLGYMPGSSKQLRTGSRQTTATVVTNVGPSLFSLKSLSSATNRKARQALARLPKDCLAELASYFAKARISTAQAGAEHVARLVDQALAAFTTLACVTTASLHATYACASRSTTW